MPKGLPTKDFSIFSNKIVKSQTFKDLLPAAKVLYYTLCRLRNQYANPKEGTGIFYQSNRDLAEESGLSRKAIFASVKALITVGIITIPKHGTRTTACYYRIMDDN